MTMTMSMMSETKSDEVREARNDGVDAQEVAVLTVRYVAAEPIVHEARPLRIMLRSPGKTLLEHLASVWSCDAVFDPGIDIAVELHREDLVAMLRDPEEAKNAETVMRLGARRFAERRVMVAIHPFSALPPDFCANAGCRVLLLGWPHDPHRIEAMRPEEIGGFAVEATLVERALTGHEWSLRALRALPTLGGNGRLAVLASVREGARPSMENLIALIENGCTHVAVLEK